MSPRLRLLGSLVLMLLVALPGRADVVINEIMAKGSDRLLRWSPAGVPTVGFGTPWYAQGFADSGWQKGVGPFGFGIFANVTAPAPGTDMATQMQSLTPTMYLRKTFAFAPADPAGDAPLVLDVQFNDGFICYLNGVEIARRNAGPPNAFNYHDQFAASATPASMEDSRTPYIRGESIVLAPVARVLLVEGTNTLAIHALNFWEASNVHDIAGKKVVAIDSKNNFFFQADLKLTAEIPVVLVRSTDEWSYFPGVAEPSGGVYDPARLFSGRLNVPWGKAAFDDETWSEGPAPFGAGNPPSGVTPGTNLTSAIPGKAKSLYLRTVFTVTEADLADGLPLQLLMDYDDSFVAYVNGVEVARDKLGQANVFTPHSAVAEGTRSGGSLATFNLDPPARLLTLGENVLSVQVHNVTQADADLFFRAQLRTHSAGTNRTMVPLTARWRYWIGLTEPGSVGEDQEPTEEDTSSEDTPEGPDASLDWVELHNNGTTSVALAGWGLSDDTKEPAKWKFPAGAEIPAGGYLLVVCDGLNITAPPANGYYHTNFKLGGDGETLTLSNAAGATQQQITYPAQTAFQSFGRSAQGALRFFDPPTPLAVNDSSALEAQVAAPVLSLTPGFYAAGSTTIGLTCPTPGASIRYTVDGSEPTDLTGTAGTSLTFSTSRAVRARAFKTGFVPSEITTGTYLINESAARRSVPALCITGDLQRSLYRPFGAMAIKGGGWTNYPSPNPTGENAKWSQVGANPGVAADLSAYNNPLQRGRFIERPGTLELLRNGLPPLFTTGFGLRVSGSNHARPRYKLTQQNRFPAVNDGGWATNDATNKSSFNFYFRNDYGTEILDAPLFPNYPVHQFHDFRIRAGKNDPFNPFVEDEFMRRLFINTGQVGSRGFISTFYVNGVYKGFYNPCEHVREEFLRQHHGGENAWDIRQVGVISAGDGLAFQEMITFLRNSPQTVLANYQGMRTRLDMVNFIDYLIVNLLGNTGDWPHNNYICARERVPGGLHRYYLWDAEGAFGDFSGNVRTNMFSNGATGSIVTTTASNAALTESIRILFTLLRVSPEFKLLFADRLQKHFFNGGALTEPRILAEWTPLKTEIQTLLGGTTMNDKVTSWIKGVGDPTRYTTTTTTNTNGTTTTVTTNSPSRFQVLFRGYFDDTLATPALVQPHLVAAGLWPATLAPELSHYGGNVPTGTAITITNPNAAGSIIYTLDGRDPRAPGNTVQGTAYNDGAPPLIHYATTLKARILNGTEWSPLIEATYTTGAAEPLLITEIMYHPADQGATSGDDYEFVEIKNVGMQMVNLAGMSLGGGIAYTFAAGSVIGPGELKVIARSSTRFAQRYPSVPVLGEYGLAQALSNSGETVDLINSTGQTLCRVGYQESSPWPEAADGGGSSLVPVQPNSNPQPANAAFWRASTLLHGSPGQDDPAPPVLKIFINELLANAPPQGQDKVELFNPHATAVDISYWWLSDSAELPKKYQLPAGTILPTGGYLVLSESDFNTGPNAFAFSANGDRVVLSSGDATGTITSTPQDLSFGPSESGVSFGRHVNSQSQEFFTAQAANTFGGVNAGPKVGPLIISELLYKPGGSGGVTAEYTELRNVSSGVLDISNWKIDGVGFTFPASTTLPPGGFLLILSNSSSTPAAFRATYGIPAAIGIYGPGTGSLNNDGERITVQKPGPPYLNNSGQSVTPLIEIDAVNYSPLAPWPAEPLTGGRSLERVNANAFGTDPLNWRSSASTSGTIGASASLSFSSWQGQHFTPAEMNAPAIGGSHGDPDGDGLSNLREWAHGLSPWQSNLDPVTTGVYTIGSDRYLSLQVRRSRSATGLTIAADTASTPGTWTLGAGLPVSSPIDNGDGTESLTFRDTAPIQAGTPSRFLRLRLGAP